MRGIRADLIVPLDDVDPDALLEFWLWRLPPTSRPLFATALGDLFLCDSHGRIGWLDVGSGGLQMVASDLCHFEELATDHEKSCLWFGQSLVDDIREAGHILKPGECYSYWQLPILGGAYEPGNFRVSEVVTHFRVWGPIHEKLKDIPDGTSIDFVVTLPVDG